MRIPSVLVLILVSIFYLIVPILILIFVKQNKTLKPAMFTWMLLFAIILLIGVLGKIDITERTMYIGYDFSGEWASKDIYVSLNNTFKLDKIINLLMLIPIGEAVCIISKRKNIKFGFVIALLMGFLSGIFIELLQFVLPVDRIVQFADVFGNMISAGIGYLYLSAIYYCMVLLKLIVTKQKCINRS